MELRAGGKERQIAPGAEVDAGLVIIQQVPTEGGLGSLRAQDAVRFGSQLFLPLGVGFDNAGNLGDGARHAGGINQTDGDGW